MGGGGPPCIIIYTMNISSMKGVYTYTYMYVSHIYSDMGYRMFKGQRMPVYKNLDSEFDFPDILRSAFYFLGRLLKMSHLSTRQRTGKSLHF